MERGKQSSSSFTSDLFDAKDSPSSSKILTSIFAPPAKVSDLSENEKNNCFETQPSSAKTAVLGEKEHNSWNKDKSPYFQVETMPFHYCSSIYYGGQDTVYTQPQSSVNPGVTTFDKNVGEDDSNSASRGNWWQGSIYY